LSSISIYMLRNYDKIGLISPEYTDQFSGYRYYSEQQILKANRIQALKAMGFGLKEMGDILEKEFNAIEFQKKLENKITEKREAIAKLEREILQMNNALSGALKEEEHLCDIVVKTLPEKNVIYYRDKIKDFQDEGKLWGVLMQACEKMNVSIVPQGFTAAIQHEINYDDNYIDVEVLVEVEKKGKTCETVKYRIIKPCEVAAIAFQGQYSKIENINMAAAKWVIENQYEICGSPINIYHISPKNEADENNFITEVCFPIKKKN